jgi:aryl-alcohol dehydrogenase-like predicted oxidoreductase
MTDARYTRELCYRHIDTARAYGNEASVGHALPGSGVQRDEVSLTTKFYPGGSDPVAEASPLTTGARLDDPRLAGVGRRHGTSRALESKRW